MLISELIAKLQSELAEHGDLQVFAVSRDETMMEPGPDLVPAEDIDCYYWDEETCARPIEKFLVV